MSKSTVTNILAVAGVMLVVAGAALYRSSRAGSDGGSSAEAARAATTASLPRLVDLGSDKCQECKQLAPILAALREEYEGRLLVEFIDVVRNPDAKAPYAIRMIPTQILYDTTGAEVWRHEGFIAKDDLKALFAREVGVE